MGRYSAPLAAVFADFAGVAEGQRVLDVGCGPGALTAELVGGSARTRSRRSIRRSLSSRGARAASGRAGPACFGRGPAVPDGTFDATLAQLVVHFMTDPVAGLREMARVSREDGVVAACVWDHVRADRGRSPCSGRPRASSIPGSRTSPGSPGALEGQLGELFDAAGLRRRRRGSRRGERRTPELRGVVGAVHARRRPRRRPCREPRSRATGGAS